MRNVLASFGMWLARRFGSVRPGEELSPASEPDDLPECAHRGDLLAISVMDRLRSKFRMYTDGADILISASVYLTCDRVRKESRHSVALWWLRDETESLLVGRSTPHEAAAPKEAKP